MERPIGGPSAPLCSRQLARQREIDGMGKGVVGSPKPGASHFQEKNEEGGRARERLKEVAGWGRAADRGLAQPRVGWRCEESLPRQRPGPSSL